VSSVELCCCSFKTSDSEKTCLNSKKVNTNQQLRCSAQSRKCNPQQKVIAKKSCCKNKKDGYQKSATRSKKCNKCDKLNSAQSTPESISDGCQCGKDIQSQTGILFISSLPSFFHPESVDDTYQPHHYLIEPQSIYYPPRRYS
jgi:hypothetical protein